MKVLISKRGFLTGALGVLAAPLWAEAPTHSLRPKARGADFEKRRVPGAEAILREAGLSGDVSFAVADVKTGLVLEERDGDRGMPPASVTKAVTALYALDALGAGHRFTTHIMATGPISGGVVSGDLILVGGGDPTLDTDGMAAMVADLKRAGIRKVSGRLLVYQGALPLVKSIDAGQPDHVGYNPTICGISLNFNRVHFEWKRGKSGYSVAMDARSKTRRPAVKVARMKIANRALPVYTYRRGDGVDHWTVAKSALGKGGSRWLPVRHPGIYAGEVLRSLAAEDGVVMPRPKVMTSRPTGKVVAARRSPELRVILRDMLKYSNNLTAEMVGMAATQARGVAPRSLKSSAGQMSAWLRDEFGMERAKLVDHSGLGEASRLHAGELTMALALARPKIMEILKDIPLRYENGKVNKAHPMSVKAKTGTLNFVSSLAGYAKGRDGTIMAFAVFAADKKARGRLARKDKEAPKGARGWNKRAKRLQQKLIERWGALYGS